MPQQTQAGSGSTSSTRRLWRPGESQHAPKEYVSKGIPDRVAPHVAVVTGIARARDAGAPQSQIKAQYQQLEKFGYTLDQARDWSRRHHSTEALRKIATEMETHLATLQLH